MCSSQSHACKTHTHARVHRCDVTHLRLMVIACLRISCTADLRCCCGACAAAMLLSYRKLDMGLNPDALLAEYLEAARQQNDAIRAKMFNTQRLKTVSSIHMMHHTHTYIHTHTYTHTHRGSCTRAQMYGLHHVRVCAHVCVGQELSARLEAWDRVRQQVSKRHVQDSCTCAMDE